MLAPKRISGAKAGSSARLAAHLGLFSRAEEEEEKCSFHSLFGTDGRQRRFRDQILVSWSI